MEAKRWSDLDDFKRGLKLRGGARNNHDICTFRCQLGRDSPSHSIRTTGDDNSLSTGNQLTNRYKEGRAGRTLPSMAKSFLDPKPSILLIVVYVMILPKTSESPKVVGDRSERDDEDVNDMRKDEERLEEGRYKDTEGRDSRYCQLKPNLTFLLEHGVFYIRYIAFNEVSCILYVSYQYVINTANIPIRLVPPKAVKPAPKFLSRTLSNLTPCRGQNCSKHSIYR